MGGLRIWVLASALAAGVTATGPIGCDEPIREPAFVSAWQPANGVDRVCEPGDRAWCHQHGTCNAVGNGCICDEPRNQRAAERCEYWHEAPEGGGGGALPEGTVCQPGEEAYCSYNGWCNGQGTACQCNSGWWNGPHCDVSSDECPGYGDVGGGAWSQEPCFGQGNCIAPGECDCYEGYSGVDCSVPTPPE